MRFRYMAVVLMASLALGVAACGGSAPPSGATSTSSQPTVSSGSSTSQPTASTGSSSSRPTASTGSSASQPTAGTGSSSNQPTASTGGAGSSAGGGASGTPLNMQMLDTLRFVPATVTVNAGQPVTIDLQNTGALLHDFTTRGMDPQVHVVVQPGQNGVAQFTVTKPGTYEFYCSQPGHEEAGMKGTLTVK